jgi:hypothetical protein
MSTASLAKARLENAARLRRQQQHRQLYHLGERAFSELLEQLRALNPGMRDDVDMLTAAYTRLDHAVLSALGGDVIPILRPRSVPEDAA